MPPPPSHPLYGAFVKLERSQQHFRELDVAAKKLVEANQDFIGREIDTKTGQRIYRLNRDPVFPPDYSVITGDVLNNLNGALDHLAYAMCLHGVDGDRSRIPEKQKRRIQFPTSEGGPADYLALDAPVKRFAKKEALQILDRIEPYNGGAGEILAQIRALNNRDKHRLLVTVCLKDIDIDVAGLLRDLVRSVSPAHAAQFSGEWQPVYRRTHKADILKAGSVLHTESIDAVEHEKVNFSFPVAINETEVLPMQPLAPFLKDAAVFVALTLAAIEQVLVPGMGPAPPPPPGFKFPPPFPLW